MRFKPLIMLVLLVALLGVHGHRNYQSAVPPQFQTKAYSIGGMTVTCDLQPQSEQPQVVTKDGDTLLPIVQQYTKIGPQEFGRDPLNPMLAVEATARLNHLGDPNRLPADFQLQTFQSCGF